MGLKVFFVNVNYGWISQLSRSEMILDNPYYYSLCNILCTNIMTHAHQKLADRDMPNKSQFSLREG